MNANLHTECAFTPLRAKRHGQDRPRRWQLTRKLKTRLIWARYARMARASAPRHRSVWVHSPRKI